MATTLLNFPLAMIVDGILSYLHHLFSTPDLTPSDYRWNSDDRKSKIRICAPFVVDNAKPMSAPFIVVERGAFTYDDRIIDNLKSADPNVQTNPNKVSICDGLINIICGSKEASEASSLANYIALMIQADRHGIINTLTFLRNLKHVDISPEIPVIKDTEVRRWEVTVRIFASIQMGWVESYSELISWKEFSIYETNNIDKNNPFSSNGEVQTGLDLLVDNTKNFGLTILNNPQLLEKELSKGWYYIRFSDNTFNQLYTISEIVDNHTLKLTTHDATGATVPWVSAETKTKVNYDLLWNTIHLYTTVKKT